MKNNKWKLSLFLCALFFLSACDNVKEEKSEPQVQQKKDTKEMITKQNPDKKNSEKTISINDLNNMANNKNFSNVNDTSNQSDERTQNFLVSDNPIYTLNQLRSTLGIQNLYENQNLNNASYYHAKYMLETNNIAHEESPDSAFFYGVTPLDRVQKSGYNQGQTFATGEVLTFTQGDINEGLDKLIRAIYHRFILLDPVYSEVGLSKMTVNGDSVLEMLLAAKGTVYKSAPIKIAIYPYSQQKNVPYVFYASEEVPNPMPNGYDRVGFPVSIQTTSGYKLTTNNFELFEKNTNVKVESKFLSSSTDNHITDSQAALIPWQPLKSNTTYLVKYSGILQNQSLNYQWEFTTTQVSNIKIEINGNEFKPGSIINIKYSAPESSKINSSTSITSTNQSLLKLEKESWGNLTYEVLPGCLSSDGCIATMDFKNEDGLSQKVTFKILQ